MIFLAIAQTITFLPWEAVIVVEEIMHTIKPLDIVIIEIRVMAKMDMDTCKEVRLKV